MNDRIRSLGQNCLRLISSEVQTSSFLGGKPLISSSINWPKKNDKPLGFIAQLDLGELNKQHAIDWLPNSGRLLFFYDFEEWPWGFDPEDRGGWAVIYENGTGELYGQDLPPDLNEEYIAPTVKYVTAEKFISYPDPQRLDFEEIGLSEDDEDDYYNFIEKLYGDEPSHQIGGFPTPIQADCMEEECQLVSGGVNCGDSVGYNSEKAEKLRKKPNDWRMVLQFDSDEDIDAMWGDMGMLYFWVKESEARNNNFSNAWMVLQCG